MVQSLDARTRPAARKPPDPVLDIWPEAPATLAQTRLPGVYLADLVLKTVYFSGPSTLDVLSARLGVMAAVIEEITDHLRAQGLIETQTNPEHAGQSYSVMAYRFGLTGKGEARTNDVLKRSRYAGLAPVPLEQYVEMTMKQSLRSKPATSTQIQEAIAPFVLRSGVRESVARAFHSGRAALIYGDSGNGKTALVDAYARSFGENILMPGAIYVNGQTVRLYDAAVHKVADIQPPDDAAAETQGLLRGGGVRTLDRRWLAVRRPVVVVGGELTAQDLEMSFDQTSGFYLAPAHLKAQDGIFVIDDFGRQQVSPAELLNRWIVPLEQGYDLLTLVTGEKVKIPFEMSVLFSTNLSPGDLADEAFLRRIPYKVRILGPGEEEMAEIARRECRRHEIDWDELGVQALVDAVFQAGRPLAKAVYPRDILTIIEDGARWSGQRARLTVESIDDACRCYFVMEEM
jgi:predicted ATPase with chaperone activity